MIITCKKEIPARWVIFAILPWASFSFNGGVTGTAFVFSLKKFVDNPAGLTFILSLPAFFSIILAPAISFLSDRIWTRFGRRKPFIITSWLGIISCLSLMPMMPNFWALLAVYVLNSIFSDFNSPMEPLKQEIVPPHERGRATGAMSWCNNFACVMFYFVMLGRFDDVTFMAGIPVVGEQVIYWSAGLLMTVMLLLIMLGIKETDPKSSLRGQRLSVKTFFGGLLDRELWPVYLLVFGSATLAAGLGPLGNLLYTDQWGYTKQEFGINIAVGGTINVFVIGLLTIFADRLNRMRAYRFLICLSVLVNALYFCYVNFVLPDRRPTLVEMIIFGETGSIIGLLTMMVYVPLVYDYVTRNKMGTYGAGANMVSKITSLITLNGVGLFIWGYAMIFQPPAGEMTRIVMRDAKSKTEIRTAIEKTTWHYPQNEAAVAPSNIHAEAWQADGTKTDFGRCWELRLRDKDSEQLAKQKDLLEKQKSPLLSREKMLRDEVTIKRRQGNDSGAKSAEMRADENKTQITEISERIAQIDGSLSDRAKRFHEEVVNAFGSQMIRDGEQVLNAKMGSALLVELPTSERPDVHSLEKILGDLRRADPKIIDLRPLKLETGYRVAVSALIEPGENEADCAYRLSEAVELAAAKQALTLFSAGRPPIQTARQRTMTLDLMLIEQPLITYVSPVMRVVNGIQAIFGRISFLDRKLTALARSLRDPSGISHIRVIPIPGERAISVTGVLPPETGQKAAFDNQSTQSPVAKRIEALLSNGEAMEPVPKAAIFYSRIEAAAATQRLTVARPAITTTYTPMKYDYMCGYIWMLLLGCTGIGITFFFSKLDAKGYIRKRGIEEVQAS